MAALQGWRRAYGALKDSTTVGLATLNSDRKDLDVALVKATNHVERPPKERHLKRILTATFAPGSRGDAAYCVRTLARRLARTRNWTVALKALIVIQMTLKDGDPTFREELLNFSQKVQILQLSNFKDDSSPVAWDCSAWVRTYALYLEEKLECFKVLKYEVETERLMHPTDGSEKAYSRIRTLGTEDLLSQLPALQQLLHRLVCCRPEGAAVNNHLIQYSLALVLKESFKIYCAINDGIINLVDKFFEMPRHEAIKALEIYQRAGQQAVTLSDFYEECKLMERTRNFQFPQLKEPPQSFLATMEEYIKEAPRLIPVPREPLQDFPERLLLTYKPEDILLSAEAVEKSQSAVEDPLSNSVQDAGKAATFSPNLDLLRLPDFDEDASGLKETAQDSGPGLEVWELALITTTRDFSEESNLAVGLDKMMLDGQCETVDEAAHPSLLNPFMSPDPPVVENKIDAMVQHHQQFQTLPMAMQANPFVEEITPEMQSMAGGEVQSMAGGSLNPFSDMDSRPITVDPPRLESNNPFGSARLL